VGPVRTLWRIDKGLAPAEMRAPDRSYSSVRSERVQELKLEAAADNEKEQKFTSKLHISNPGAARFFAPVQTGPGAHPASCTMGTGSFLGVKSGRGVTQTP